MKPRRPDVPDTAKTDLRPRIESARERHDGRRARSVCHKWKTRQCANAVPNGEPLPRVLLADLGDPMRQARHLAAGIVLVNAAALRGPHDLRLGCLERSLGG